MLFTTLLLSLALPAPAPTQGSLLATVPEDAYTLVHCRDVAALRGRAERNDWYRLLGSTHGEPLLSDLAYQFHAGTHSDMDELLALASALEGEAVFFDTGSVAGFVTEPPSDRETFAGLVRDWMPEADPAARRTLAIEGGTVELVAWPDQIDGWTGRAGHFAAFIDHPGMLAIYSGDSSESVVAAVTAGVQGLASERRAPVVSSYLGYGGGLSEGIEFFVDFTPLAEQAEAALKQAVEGVLPDPSDLLGLERGTWLHASADVFPGTRVDCRGRLHLPQDTLVARLADTFQPLPHTLPADLPRGIWALWALNWDLKLFHQRARSAFEEAGRAEGLAMVDAGLEAAQGMTDVDPIEDLINQLEGDFAFYLVDPPADDSAIEDIPPIGFHAGLLDGDVFLEAFDKLIAVGGMDSVFELEDLAGVDAYVANEDGGFDGGIAFLPDAFTLATKRGVLERGLRALLGAEGASSLDGSRMQAAIDENAGACFLSCVEMTPLRFFWLPEHEGDLQLPPLEEGQPARSPFDSQLVSSARRTADGFEFRLHTR